jgi:hypothetical protein
MLNVLGMKQFEDGSLVTDPEVFPGCTSQVVQNDSYSNHMHLQNSAYSIIINQLLSQQ